MSNIGKSPVFISSNVKLKTYKNFIIMVGLFGKLKLKCSKVLGHFNLGRSHGSFV